jgi:glycerophosphoryl diester phosphodiesterase
MLVAHRGDSARCPENTVAAFDAAILAKVDGIELDLRPTRDHQVVVCHDASLARFHGGSRPLARQTLAEACQQDIGSWFAPRFHQQRLLSLDQLLERYAPKAQLLLELKAAAGIAAGARNRTLCQETVRAIHRHRAQDRVFILGFSARMLEMVFALDPRLRLVRNCLHRPRHLQAWLSRQAPLHGIDLDHRMLTRGLISACHGQGLKVFTWSCNREQDLQRVRALGVDGILSDRPEWLTRLVRGHG